MKLARLAVLLVLPIVVASSCLARTVTIVITGKVVSGADASGVFGQAGANLAGKPFTLIFSFDQPNASTQPPECKGTPPYSPVICTSQRPSESPTGTATLQIGNSAPFEFGVPAEHVNSSATRTTWVSPLSSYRMTLGVGDGRTMVAGYVGSAAPKPVPPMAANPSPPPSTAWDYPFSDSAATSTPGISFVIAKPGVQANGLLDGTTICVGDTCAAATACRNIVLADAAGVTAPQVVNDASVVTDADQKCTPNAMRIQLQRNSDGLTMGGNNAATRYGPPGITKFDLNQILITIPDRAKAWQPFPNRLLPQLQVAIRNVRDKLAGASMICGLHRQFIQEIIPDKLGDWRIDVDNLSGCNLWQ